jgi:hypothetical protein
LSVGCGFENALFEVGVKGSAEQPLSRVSAFEDGEEIFLRVGGARDDYEEDENRGV